MLQLYRVKTKDPALIGHDLSHVIIGRRSLTLVSQIPLRIVSIVPLWFPLRNMFSHIKQYQFASEHIKDKQVLDIACGVGYGSEILRLHNNTLTGVDLNPSNISYAKKTYPDNKYLVGNAEDLSFFGNSCFDAIVSIQTIEHLWHPRKAIGEFHRVLRKDGFLVGAIPISHKHEMPSFAEAPNAYLFEDCKDLLTPFFKEITWFFHHFKDHTFKAVTEEFFSNIGLTRGDFCFIARNKRIVSNPND